MVEIVKYYESIISTFSGYELLLMGVILLLSCGAYIHPNKKVSFSVFILIGFFFFCGVYMGAYFTIFVCVLCDIILYRRYLHLNRGTTVIKFCLV